MSSDIFVLDFADFKMPNTIFQEFYTKRDTIESAIIFYLDEKANKLSNYINIENPLIYIPTRYHYSNYINRDGKARLFKYLIQSEHFVLNFNIPIKICNEIINYDIRGIHDVLRSNIKVKKQKLVCDINDSSNFSSTIRIVLNEERNRILTNSYFVIKLIMNIEKKLGISIYNQTLYTNAKIKYDTEKKGTPEDKTEKQLDLTSKCDRYIEYKNRYIAEYTTAVANYKQKLEEMKQLRTSIVQLKERNTQLAQKYIDRYNRVCVKGEEPSHENIKNNEENDAKSYMGGKHIYKTLHSRDKTAKRQRSRKQTIRRHKRRTN